MFGPFEKIKVLLLFPYVTKNDTMSWDTIPGWPIHQGQLSTVFVLSDITQTKSKIELIHMEC